VSVASDVVVDADGHITLWGHRVTQKDAVDLSIALVMSVRHSIDRNQRNTPAYYDSEAIIRRMESPLGRALSALRKVF
jgi:hypothetical protein